MVSMDGNNSLKRIGSSIRTHDDLFDSHSIHSNCWITPEEVNCFKDEVAQVSSLLLPMMFLLIHSVET